MVRAGAARRELAEALSSAYCAGLLSERTLAHRLELLFGGRVVEPMRLVGDLSARPRRDRALERMRAMAHTLRERIAQAVGGVPRQPALLLALDWSGSQHELLVGRHPSCDVVLAGPHVSRRHALLSCCDGAWVLRDLGSTNGTRLNDAAVVRSRLYPGDLLAIGPHRLRVD